jgi:hypothetical protein
MQLIEEDVAAGERSGSGSGFQALPGDPDVDDRTAAYILETRASFDALRDAAAQLAGLLVLVATGTRERVLDEPILERATTAYREAKDKLRSTKAPAPAAHHHHHLSLASEYIGEALRVARQGNLRLDASSLDRAHRVLQAGWREMLSASKCLPGFQVVDFSQSCCAPHWGRAASLRTTSESVREP